MAIYVYLYAAIAALWLLYFIKVVFFNNDNDLTWLGNLAMALFIIFCAIVWPLYLILELIVKWKSSRRSSSSRS